MASALDRSRPAPSRFQGFRQICADVAADVDVVFIRLSGAPDVENISSRGLILAQKGHWQVPET
eukprot:scaffold34141_cov90-Isochrysis_galbana.AAC.3